MNKDSEKIEAARKGRAEIISIGDELLIGQVVNTNASFMGEQLSMNGLAVGRISAIGDDEQAIMQALDEAASRAQFVFITGGLGPTADDITKPALCRYFNTEMVFNQQALDQVEALFRRRGFPMSERNRQQAWLPASCRPVRNIHGTAPGMWFEKEGVVFVSMPGVPFEMKTMFVDEVIPEVRKRAGGMHYLQKTVMTTGVGESFLADRIKEWEEQLPPFMKLAYLPQPGLVRLRLSGRLMDAALLQNTLNEQVDKLVSLIPEVVYGYDDLLMEEVVGQLLKQQAKTVSTAESCTGGYIAHLFTSIAGSSAYFQGSVVAYANQAKMALLGVDENLINTYGAVSQQVVEAMALGAQERFHTDFALATSGIAGPDGGSEEKPVGTTWIALAGPDGVAAERFQFGEHRGRNIRRAALTAINMLRLALTEKK